MLQLFFNAFVLGLVASPTCPSSAEEIKLGTRYGFSSALSVVLGAVSGDAVVLLVLWLGLYPIIQRYQVAATALWFLGASVLAYVAWGIFKEVGTVTAVAETNKQDTPASATLARAFWIGLSITTFNPFTALWWLGLLGPTFASHQTLSIPFVSAVLVGSLAWFAGLAFMLKLARHWLTRRVRQWIMGLSGVVVVGYALFFLWKGVASVL